MNTLDSIVLFGYFISITIYGLWLARKAKTSDSYFRGNRKFKWWIMMGQSFGTGTQAEMPVAQTGASYQMGFATIWYQWKNMLITPFYWLLAPYYRRSERTTIAEILEDRYGARIAFVYTIFALTFFVFNMGAMLQGAAKVIHIASGGMLSSNTIVIVMTVAFLVYSFFGGLIAAARTEFIQSFLIIILSFMLIPFGLKAVDGFDGMRQTLPEDFFSLFNESSGLGAFTIAMLAVNGIVGITAQPHQVSMCATGNTERAGRVGNTYGSLVKRLCTIGWALTGVIVAAIVIKEGVTLEDPEMAFGYACRALLTPGLFGLMIAAIVAANMSSCSNFMVNTGALFTKNLYIKFINAKPSDFQLLKMGRLSGLFMSLFGVLFALTIDNVLQVFLFTETIAAFMGIIFLGGILWKRANRFGAMGAVISSFSVYYIINYLAAGKLQLVYKWQPDHFGWAMLAGFGAFIIISLLTRPEPKAAIDHFFDNMSRVSDEEGLAPGEEKPLAATRGKDLLLTDIPGWLRAERWKNFFSRYREDVFGFLISWFFVGVLLLLAWVIMQL
ncbi:MAG: sodium:solute symporter family protein [Cyclobacteriaceae bacterium]|nr:sodium:solute symporter family protein [Cyclobacteriaceae bacterium]